MEAEGYKNGLRKASGNDGPNTEPVLKIKKKKSCTVGHLKNYQHH